MKNPKKSSQIELQKLQEIGDLLHRVRTEKKISLDTVAAKTLIPKRLLLAIENGDANELPEPFYTKALIVKFARAIGTELPEFTLVSTDTDRSKKFASSQKRNSSTKYPINFQLRSLHLYLLYILLVGLSVRGIAGLVERPVVIEQASEINSENDSSSDADLAKDSASAGSRDLLQNNTSSQDNGAAGKTLPALVVDRSSHSEGVMIGIDLEERCWLKVVVDGQKVFEGTLPKGTKRTWTGEERVTIRAGNAGGVAVTFNNKKQQILGEPGEVQEVTYTVN